MREISLTPTTWEWKHQDNYVWTEIPAMNDPQDKKRQFLVSALNSNVISSKPFENCDNHENSDPKKDKPVAFQRFINLDGTPESFIQFANEFGHLLLKKYSHDKFWTTSLEFWVEEHWKFKIAYKLWHELKYSSDESLKKVLKMFVDPEGDMIYFALTEDPCWYDHFNAESNKRFSGFKLLSTAEGQPVAIGLGLKINEETSNYSIVFIGQVLLHFLVNEQLKLYPTIAQLQYIDGSSQQSYIPQNLLAAMWFNFFQVITGERKIKQCLICRQWADVTGTKSSWIKHRECANWDRVTKIRKLNQVIALHEAGKSIAEISAEVNVEPHHIERWLDIDKD